MMNHLNTMSLKGLRARNLLTRAKFVRFCTSETGRKKNQRQHQQDSQINQDGKAPTSVLMNDASGKEGWKRSGSTGNAGTNRVAEGELRYDHVAASNKLVRKPSVWMRQNLKLLYPATLFVSKIILDHALNRQKQNRRKRAAELLNIFNGLSPALVKAGQSLSSRSDLLPVEYLEALQKLQDRCPPYPTAEAVALFEREMHMKFDDAFTLDHPEPVAAASIGQVYKGTLKSNGAKVAIKIQRPHCEESVAVDLFILRWYAAQLQRALALLGRDVNLTSVIDDFGHMLYRELDYRAEATNALRFAELYSGLKDIHVPKIYTNLSSSKVLVMEWVDGVRLHDARAIQAMGFERARFVNTLVQCSMRQILENGFFHADPHAGNLLAMSNGKLCYLDFGMVSYAEPAQRYSMIEAVVHMVNRDFRALAMLYQKMGFIPAHVNIDPIVEAFERALPDALNSAVGDFNFRNVMAKLGDVMYKFPFSLPPFYIAIIRCLGVLEGLALQVDKDFRIIRATYPFIASRLLTDPSDELQRALQHYLFEEAGQLRWDRLRDLLQEATVVGDYDISIAADQLVAHLASESGRGLRELLAVEAVETMDSLETETVRFLLRCVDEYALGSPVSLVKLFVASDGRLNVMLNKLLDRLLEEIETTTAADSSLRSARSAVLILRASKGHNKIGPVTMLRKVYREPVLTELLTRIFREVNARLKNKVIRRATGQETVFAPVTTNTNNNSSRSKAK